MYVFPFFLADTDVSQCTADGKIKSYSPVLNCKGEKFQKCVRANGNNARKIKKLKKFGILCLRTC